MGIDMARHSLLSFVFFLFWSFSASASSKVSLEVLVQERFANQVPAPLGISKVSIPKAPLVSPESELSFSYKATLKEGWVSVQVALPSKKKVWAKVELTKKQEVLVTTRAIAKGEELSAADVKLVELPIREGVALSLLPEALVGSTASQALPAGGVLTEKDVTLAPAIARGTEVRVIVKAGAITISTKGLLEKSARLGELTSVRLADGSRLVKGTLRTANTVVVQGE
jgi:flagella basal body P-ring formation protein FlgA